MRTRWHRPATALVTLLLALLAGALPAHAADEDTLRFGLAPGPQDGAAPRSAIDLVLDPGGTATDYVSVTNLSSTPQVFELYAADAVLTRDGDVTVGARTSALRDVGGWVGFDTTTVEVPADRRVDVPFRVTVPADATPGEHLGAVVASPVRAGATGDGTGVVVDARAAVRLDVLVPGPVRSELEVVGTAVDYAPALGGLAGGTLTVRYTVANPGNVRQSGQVRLSPAALGWAGGDVLADVPEIPPGQQAEQTIALTGVPPLVWVTAALELTPAAPDGFSAAPPSTADLGAWAAPWVAGAALLLAAGAVTLGVRRRRRRRAARGEVVQV